MATMKSDYVRSHRAESKLPYAAIGHRNDHWDQWNCLALSWMAGLLSPAS